ncbi:hypothetical protein ATK36_3248 [Amycolatopsis sulphurea]|uniref:Uncharacterized protein n=1 Tax=Amycolatopsis sulphurea TaxID=76022 RepID=A0A2A9FA01_9PSEU|nr:hypothetical protein [Amycolatopsis sulphurea]PFG48174.1 hypothetical protein ATK36_3248 [Amycolatopsis sulphurea]
MTGPEDELDQRLRTLFADERLAVEPADDATSVIVAGVARRRRHRRMLNAAAGVVCVLTIGAGGLVAFQLRAHDTGVAVSAPPAAASGASAAPTSSSPPPSTTSKEPEPSSSAVAVPPPSAEMHSSLEPPKPGTSKPSPGRTTVPTLSGALVTASGLGAVQLGMSEQQLADKGITLTQVKESSGCKYYDVTGAGVPAATAVVSSGKGVVAVKPVGAAHTPEGVGDGSTKGDVAAAYPGTSEASGALVSPAGDQGTYRFTLSSNGAVQSVEVRTATQSCLN